MDRLLGKRLFQMAKSPFVGKMTGIAFQYCSWCIPVKKVCSSRDVLVFFHPQPSYPNHLILTPKKALRNLQQMASSRFCGYLMKIWENVRTLHIMRPAFHHAFVLVANGGKRQEVQQVHFHMFTDHELVKEYAVKGSAGRVILRDETVEVAEHPKPEWEFHFVLRPAPHLAADGDERDQSLYFSRILQCIDRLDAKFHITEKGYSLVFQYNKENEMMEYPVFHIISGKRQTN